MFFFVKQKTAYEMRISDWSSDVCSSDLARICQEDLNEVITAFVQDKTAIERGLFDDELVPEELTQVRLGKIIKDTYPELDEEDQEAVRQHAVAALNLTPKAKEIALGGAEADQGGNMALIDGVRKFAPTGRAHALTP